jgi:hypothetical protein
MADRKRTKRCSQRTASFRAFCEEVVLQTNCPASETDWPPVHFDILLDSVGISGDDEMLK